MLFVVRQARATLVGAPAIGKTNPNGASRTRMVVVRQAFERAGVEFINENGGGPGVRLRKRQRLKKPK